MTRRAELEHHLSALEDIHDIMASMKTLALLETRKLGRFMDTQRRVEDGIERIAADYLAHYPRPPTAADLFSVTLLVGSERGFVGDFNEVLIRHWQDQSHDRAVIGLGQKLAAKLAQEPRTLGVLEGASIAEEIPDILTRLVGQLAALQTEHGELALTVVHHGESHSEILTTPVLPPFQALPPVPARSHPPRLNLAPPAFFEALLDHYLFAFLHTLLYRSLMAENQRRIEHLGGALHHLEEETEALQLKRNALRQEEIVEEIEVILLSVQAMLEPHRPGKRKRRQP
ncbi:MAG TPA: F0F1 ATP synthase subunit gamma [Chromatiales bacterium]|nr:F0F1 ATP synthase subunit gamma [Chromatiales bacterium]